MVRYHSSSMRRVWLGAGRDTDTRSLELLVHPKRAKEGAAAVERKGGVARGDVFERTFVSYSHPSILKDQWQGFRKSARAIAAKRAPSRRCALTK